MTEITILTQDNHFLINGTTMRLVRGLRALGIDVVVLRTSPTPKGKKASKFNILREMQGFAGTGFVLRSICQYAISKFINSRRKLQSICKLVDIPDNEKLTPEVFKKHCRDFEVLFILSGTRIITRDVLDLWSHGAINLHSSTLPYSKGLMPALWTFAQSRGLGVTLFRLNEKIDDGEIIYQVPIAQRAQTYMKHLHQTKHIGVVLFLTWAVLNLLKAETTLDIEETYNKYPDANFSLANYL